MEIRILSHQRHLFCREAAGEEMRVLRNDPSLKDWIQGKESVDSEDKAILGNIEEINDCASGDGESISVSSRISELRGNPVWNKKKKPLSMLPLAAIIFYGVSGGPFGIEVFWSFTGSS